MITTLIIDIYFYDILYSYSKHLGLALNSLDTLSGVRIKVLTILF